MKNILRHLLFTLLCLQTLPSIITLIFNGYWYLSFIPILVFGFNMYFNIDIAIKMLKKEYR